ncbi:MAG TPA: hypothetical protein VFH83_15060 [Spirochaetia bacterium]|nr:hypothetical protein [Spirochaetia bacterium]
MRDDVTEALEPMTNALLRKLGPEVDLIFRYGSTLKGTTHVYSDLDVSYVPVHESTGDSITVLVADVLIDLYPIHWSQLESMADFENVSASVLLENQLIYHRNEAVVDRLRSLASKLRSNLEPSARAPMLQTAQRLFQRIGYDFYLLREQAAAGHRLSCLYQASKITRAVFHCLAACNQACVDTRRVDRVLALPKLPVDFATTVQSISNATQPQEILGACERLMSSTRALLLREQRSMPAGDATFPSVFRAAYPELKGSIQHAKLASDRGDRLDPSLVSLYHEVMVHMAQATTGVSYGSFSPIADYEQDLTALGFPDLMGAFVAGDPKPLGEPCDVFDERLKEYLQQHGVGLNAFGSVEDLRTHLETD